MCEYICRFYVDGKFKLSGHGKHYEKNYKILQDKYKYSNIRVEKILIGRRFDNKLNTIISKIRELEG